ncbi:DUF4340 domain-containing protein [bacterium AH-315-E10]|nr:DUF4340 domain-containing protein [bacterium AH-315-E10]
MAKQTSTTVIFLITAIILLVCAGLIRPKDINNSAFSDQGEGFYSNFTDPLTSTELTVINFNEALGMATPFNVTLKKGRWLIPSHHNYPADAKEKMESIAAGLIGIIKDEIRSEQPADHAALGVINPDDMSVSSISGRGTRVTLKNKSGQILCDYIIGKDVEGKDGFKYVRIPKQNRTYAAKIDLSFSTEFSDWVETDLLQLSAVNINQLNFRNYSINEGKMIQGKSFQLTQKESKWSITGMPADKEINTQKVTSVTTTLSDLEITGVRKKPEGLASFLKVAKKGLSQMDMISLNNKGFYIHKNQLFSNEGELHILTKDAVVYVIRFGELFFGTGLDITAGAETDQSKKDENEKKKGSANRYIFITADFSPEHKPEPEKPGTKPEKPADDAKDDVKKAYDLALTAFNEKSEKHADWIVQVKTGKKKAKELNDHYADWYYVISGGSYDKIKVPYTELLQDAVKEDDKKDDPNSPNIPSNFKFPVGPSQ